MAKYTRQDILELIDEEDIEFIRLQFTDISGNLKNMATTIDQLDKILDGHYKFDCAAIDGFRGYFSLASTARQGCTFFM